MVYLWVVSMVLKNDGLFSLASPDEYRNDGRCNIFPTKASLDWFIRKHRHSLIKNKALVYPTGRKLISPERFDQFIGSVTFEEVSP